MIKQIIVHADCPDGLASAMILRLRYPEATVHFLQYNTPELAAFQPAPGQVWCDFSPPVDRAAEFVAAGAYVLDHHKTAKDVVAMFGERGLFADEKEQPGVSGAVLAAKFTDASPEVTSFARIVGVRDTWQKNSPLWKEACDFSEALMFWPSDTWLYTPPSGWYGLTGVGHILESKHQELCKKTLKDACRVIVNRLSLEDLRVVIFQGPSHVASDAAEIEGPMADVVVGFSYFVENENSFVSYSVRSRGTFDCGAFAKQHGGGGHSGAGGFRVTATMDPYSQFLVLLLRYLEAPMASFA